MRHAMHGRALAAASLTLLIGFVQADTPESALADPSSAYPGGSATYLGKLDRNAFSHPSSGLSLERKLDFRVGGGFFERLWVTAPASTQAADGLGPLYNGRSCLSCHPRHGRGRPPEGGDHSNGDTSISMLLRVDIPPQTEAERRALQEHRTSNIPDPVYGTQLQALAVAGHKAEYRLGVTYEELPVQLGDGEIVHLRKPTYTAEDLGYGPLHPHARLSPRVAPQMIGLGLLEAVDPADILAHADPQDADGDGVSGRPNRVWSRKHGKVMLGRYGHKAGMPGVDEQSQAAFAHDIGISTPLYPDGSGDCTAQQPHCRQAPSGNSPQYDGLEAHQTVTDLVALFARHLAVPARRDAEHPDVLAGQALFSEIGCALCHRPQFVTGEDADHALAGQTIWPYTDLLLHDMGEGLADHRPEGEATGREWRTAPLWGIGLTPLVSGHSFYLHDGRARSVLEAVLWHGGEAEPHRDAVVRLSKAERDQLIRFVESL